MLETILLATILVSATSLLLVSVLLLHKNLIKKISFLLVSFAAGSLLATGFMDTLKEAVELKGTDVFLWTTIAIAVFFIIERLFLSLHHHAEEDNFGGKDNLKLPTPFLLFGDSLHNFIDGMSIAAGFLVNFQVGLITSFAVFIHEIPHELGDFGILISKGWGRFSVLWVNAATGIACIFGAITAYYLGQQFEGIVPLLLSITTANFIYLSTADLLPEIHHKSQKGLAIKNTISFLLGILLVAILTTFVGE